MVKISGDEKSHTVTVEHDPSVATVETIQGALRQLGYESSLVT